MNEINLELLAVDGKARVNKVKINKHEFNTPIFMPVATRGSIKSVNLVGSPGPLDRITSVGDNPKISSAEV